MAREKNVLDTRVTRARDLRRNMTDAEKVLWRHLRAEPFKSFHIRRQATIGPYIVDFASHAHRTVVEVDGGQHSDNKADLSRTAHLEARGYRVLRFWNHDVLQNCEGVLTQLLGRFETLTPHPQPLPAASAGGGELPASVAMSRTRSEG